MTKVDAISQKLLKKMLSHHICNAKHHGIDDLKGDVETALKKLTKENLIIRHTTSCGFQYALNYSRLDEIKDMIEW